MNDLIRLEMFGKNMETSLRVILEHMDKGDWAAAREAAAGAIHEAAGIRITAATEREQMEAYAEARNGVYSDDHDDVPATAYPDHILMSMYEQRVEVL